MRPYIILHTLTCFFILQRIKSFSETLITVGAFANDVLGAHSEWAIAVSEGRVAPRIGNTRSGIVLPGPNISSAVASDIAFEWLDSGRFVPGLELVAVPAPMSDLRDFPSDIPVFELLADVADFGNTFAPIKMPFLSELSDFSCIRANIFPTQSDCSSIEEEVLFEHHAKPGDVDPNEHVLSRVPHGPVYHLKCVFPKPFSESDFGETITFDSLDSSDENPSSDIDSFGYPHVPNSDISSIASDSNTSSANETDSRHTNTNKSVSSIDILSSTKIVNRGEITSDPSLSPSQRCTQSPISDYIAPSQSDIAIFGKPLPFLDLSVEAVSYAGHVGSYRTPVAKNIIEFQRQLSPHYPTASLSAETYEKIQAMILDDMRRGIPVTLPDGAIPIGICNEIPFAYSGNKLTRKRSEMSLVSDVDSLIEGILMPFGTSSVDGFGTSPLSSIHFRSPIHVRNQQLYPTHQATSSISPTSTDSLTSSCTCGRRKGGSFNEEVSPARSPANASRGDICQNCTSAPKDLLTMSVTGLATNDDDYVLSDSLVYSDNANFSTVLSTLILLRNPELEKEHNQLPNLRTPNFSPGLETSFLNDDASITTPDGFYNLSRTSSVVGSRPGSVVSDIYSLFSEGTSRSSICTPISPFPSLTISTSDSTSDSISSTPSNTKPNTPISLLSLQSQYDEGSSFSTSNGHFAQSFPIESVVDSPLALKVADSSNHNGSTANQTGITDSEHITDVTDIILPCSNNSFEQIQDDVPSRQKVPSPTKEKRPTLAEPSTMVETLRPTRMENPSQLDEDYYGAINPETAPLSKESSVDPKSALSRDIQTSKTHLQAHIIPSLAQSAASTAVASNSGRRTIVGTHSMQRVLSIFDGGIPAETHPLLFPNKKSPNSLIIHNQVDISLDDYVGCNSGSEYSSGNLDSPLNSGTTLLKVVHSESDHDPLDFQGFGVLIESKVNSITFTPGRLDTSLPMDGIPTKFDNGVDRKIATYLPYREEDGSPFSPQLSVLSTPLFSSTSASSSSTWDGDPKECSDMNVDPPKSPTLQKVDIYSSTCVPQKTFAPIAISKVKSVAESSSKSPFGKSTQSETLVSPLASSTRNESRATDWKSKLALSPLTMKNGGKSPLSVDPFCSSRSGPSSSKFPLIQPSVRKGVDTLGGSHNSPLSVHDSRFRSREVNNSDISSQSTLLKRCSFNSTSTWEGSVSSDPKGLDDIPPPQLIASPAHNSSLLLNPKSPAGTLHLPFKTHLPPKGSNDISPRTFDLANKPIFPIMNGNSQSLNNLRGQPQIKSRSGWTKQGIHLPLHETLSASWVDNLASLRSQRKNKYPLFGKSLLDSFIVGESAPASGPPSKVAQTSKIEKQKFGPQNSHSLSNGQPKLSNASNLLRSNSYIRSRGLQPIPGPSQKVQNDSLFVCAGRSMSFANRTPSIASISRSTFES